MTDLSLIYVFTYFCTVEKKFALLKDVLDNIFAHGGDTSNEILNVKSVVNERHLRA